jgi:putative ABC transport system substrate-binding protein
MCSIRRREFITLLGGAAAWPLTAGAQQPAMPVIGLLHIASSGAWLTSLAGFRQGLNQAGFVDGRTVTIESRWAESQFDRLPMLTADLLRLQAAVFFANGPPAVRAIRAQSATVPIVFFMGEDPVKEGLVESLNRPGGNITGVTNFQNQLFGKELGLLREILPKGAVIAFLINPRNPNAEPDTNDARTAAVAAGQELRVFAASTEGDLRLAFAAMAQQGIGGLLVGVDSFGLSAEHFTALVAQYAIPAIYNVRNYPVAGGLMSYGASRVEAWRQAGTYVGRILKSEKAGELPVLQSTKFEFVLNLQTARALNIEVPSGILSIADEVIE